MHKLVTVPGFVTGKDAYCETCYSPDYQDEVYTDYDQIVNATDKEVAEWFFEHVLSDSLDNRKEYV